MAQDPYRYFRIEARELADQLGQTTLELEKEGGGTEQVQRLLRIAHTLKGAARVVKQREIADLCHAIEEALDAHRENTTRVPRETIDTILEMIDAVSALVSALAAAQSDPEVANKQAPDEPLRMVRADVAEVDALLDGLTETTVQLNALRRATGQIERARHLGDLLKDQLAPRGNRKTSRFDAEKTFSMAEDLRAIIGALERSTHAAVDQMERELVQVRGAAEHLRLIPAGSLFVFLERTARDTARSLGKDVVFEGRGGDVRIDAHVLGAVQAALVQLIRNAVAHGIETASQRTASGKARAGRVIVEIVRRGRRVVFRCQDDGRGIDVDAIRRTAAKKGLSPAHGRELSVEELVRLLLRGGISTSSVVTEVSGRGVGLDVVREALERLGGDVRVHTERGRGSEFELIVPLSLASIQGLSVEGSGIVAILPLDAVKQAIRVVPGDVSRTASGESVVFEGKVVPFVPLTRALRVSSVASTRSNRAASAIIVESSGRAAALGVDRVLGTGNVVLRPLPDLAPADSIVSGATIDAEGNPQMVLDPDGIIDAAVAPVSLESGANEARRPVLVIDDSLTTRMLEQSILESAGYEVDLATSAEEGLEVARKRKYGLFLVDVEMPGMDGFTFIERVRADPMLRGIPAILVTSRSAPEDRERGARVGAQGYVVKSDFDQSDLVARIGELME